MTFCIGGTGDSVAVFIVLNRHSGNKLSAFSDTSGNGRGRCGRNQRRRAGMRKMIDDSGYINQPKGNTGFAGEDLILTGWYSYTVFTITRK